MATTKTTFRSEWKKEFYFITSVPNDLWPVRNIIGTAHITVLGQLPPRGIAPSTPKLTLTQTVTLTSGQFFFGQLSGYLPPNLKTNLNLDPHPNPNWEVIFLAGQLSGYLILRYFFCDIIKCAIFLPNMKFGRYY